MDLVAASPHLADACGWLEDDGPFFRQLERVVADRAEAEHDLCVSALPGLSASIQRVSGRLD